MVTILEPGQLGPGRLEPGVLETGRLEVAESAPAQVQPRNMGDRRAMTYSMPFPGVRYYAYSPEPSVEDWLPALKTVRQTLPVKLIDERVILL